MSPFDIVAALATMIAQIAKSFQLSNDELRAAVEKGLGAESGTEKALKAFHDKYGKPE